MIPRILISIVTMLATVLHADHDDPESGANGHGFWLLEVEESQTTRGGSDTPETAASAPTTPAVILGQAACAGADQAAGGLFTVTFCPGTTPNPNQPTLTLTDIRHAFAELPLPRPTLVIQPPDGLTLVNLDTNFYTPDPHPLTRTVTLLGHQVTIRATPATFTWHYGDQTTRTTTDPGAPYPQLRITHRYERKGRYHPSLATTFTGAFRLDGAGPWQTIPGTVTLTSTPQAVRAVEAAPTLVGY